MRFVADLPHSGEWPRSKTSPFGAILIIIDVTIRQDLGSRPFHPADHRSDRNELLPRGVTALITSHGRGPGASKPKFFDRSPKGPSSPRYLASRSDDDTLSPTQGP